MSKDVLDALEADLEAILAVAGLHVGSASSGAVVANPIDFVLPVWNMFAILDPIGGDIRSGVHGSTVEDGDVEVLAMTDDAGEEVPSEPRRRPPCRRLVLVPRTPLSVQDSSRHGRFTASESGEDSLFLPVLPWSDGQGWCG